ncbi:MAG: hypothetical protein HN531_07425 [Opitutae bacterium]|nr:hypothetical protein [Opitutae bacterium]
MKKLIISLIASFMLCAFAYSEDKERPQTGGSDPKPQKPGEGGEKPEVGRPAPKPFPPHWGKPPAAQTKDLRPLPGGFGMGSSTLANWIKENIEEDKANGKGPDGEKPKVERPRFPLHWGKPPEIQLTDHVKLPGNFGEGSSTLAHWIKENIEEDKANGKGPGKEKPDILTDKEKLDPRKVEAEVLQLVKEGKISQEDARKKLDAIRGEMEKRGEFKRPKRPKKPELSEDVKNTLQGIKDLQDALAKEMKTKLDGLKKDGATREEMREAVHAFQKDNKDSLEDIRKLHNKIHSHLKVPHKPERPELTPKIKVEVEVLKEKQKELHTARKDLHENLKDKSKEDREELIADFKKNNKTKHEAIKDQAKVVKEEIRALVETEATRTSDL